MKLQGHPFQTIGEQGDFGKVSICYEKFQPFAKIFCSQKVCGIRVLTRLGPENNPISVPGTQNDGAISNLEEKRMSWRQDGHTEGGGKLSRRTVPSVC